MTQSIPYNNNVNISNTVCKFATRCMYRTDEIMIMVETKLERKRDIMIMTEIKLDIK